MKRYINATSEFEYAKKLIKQKMIANGIDYSLTVKSKRTGEKFIIAQQYPTSDGWFVYRGCDLVVGDVTFDYAVRVLLQETR